MNPIWVDDDLIFIKVVTSYPAAGYRDPTTGAFYVTGSEVLVWSCAITGANAYCLFSTSTVVHPSASAARAYGWGVRCVQYLLLFK
jgi:hypothetical protein